MKLNIPVKSARDGQLSAERLVNCYAEAGEGRANVQVISVPGMRLATTTGGGSGRGLFVHNDKLYAVVGQMLYKIEENYSVTALGTVAGVGIAQGASSGLELCVVSEGWGYIYDGSTLTQITDSDFPAATSVTYLDGYFIFGDGTESFYISALYAGGSIDALDFASAESNPDNIIRPFVDHRELLLFGTDTVETWVNTGDPDFPFERVAGGITEKGIAGGNAVAKIDNTVFWLDNDGVVRRMANGYSPQRISTHEVERTITSPENAECFAFVWQGHEFFVMSLPTITWIFDAATQLWHERKSFDETRWRARGYAYCYGKHFVGDYENGNIYELDDDVYTEGGDPLTSEFVFPVIHNEGDRFRLHKIMLDMEVGEADAPEIRLDLSEDGSDWFTVGTQTLGDLGHRQARVVWRRLGQHRYLHLKFLISDPCKRALYNGYGEVSADK